MIGEEEMLEVRGVNRTRSSSTKASMAAYTLGGASAKEKQANRFVSDLIAPEATRKHPQINRKGLVIPFSGAGGWPFSWSLICG